MEKMNKAIRILVGVILVDSIYEKYKKHKAKIEDARMRAYIEGYNSRMGRLQNCN